MSANSDSDLQRWGRLNEEFNSLYMNYLELFRQACESNPEALTLKSKFDSRFLNHYRQERDRGRKWIEPLVGHLDTLTEQAIQGSTKRDTLEPQMGPLRDELERLRQEAGDVTEVWRHTEQ